MAFADLIAHALALRHDLHRHPELSWAEHRTAQVVRAELTRLGIAWRACADTGTVAHLPGGPGPHLAFRADLDALPLTEATGAAHTSQHAGVMHACGHDGHTASLLATAAWLAGKPLPGPVTLLFQPAEEGGHGAKRMVDEGCLDDVDAVYGFHNWPPLGHGAWACPDGPVMAANGEWTATITGRGGHAAAPHLCIDPILAGAHFTALAQQLISRQVAPQEAAVVGVTCFHAGTADNIIPDSAELVGTIRAGHTARRDELARRLDGCLQAACSTAGATGRLVFTPTYPATVNHPVPAARVREVLGRLVPGGERPHGLPLMTAEDFSYYLERVPGAYVLLGGDGEVCHSPRFDFDDRLISLAARLWADLAGVPIIFEKDEG